MYKSAPNLGKIYINIRSWMSSIMSLIGPDLVKIYMTNRSQTNLIIGLIGPERSELFTLDIGKIAALDVVYTSSIYKHRPISTKLGQDVCYHNISDEFNYGSHGTRSVRVICL